MDMQSKSSWANILPSSTPSRILRSLFCGSFLSVDSAWQSAINLKNRLLVSGDKEICGESATDVCMRSKLSLAVACSCQHHTWWRHQMETFFALLALCVGNSPVTGEFPSQRPVTRSFDIFFDLHLNKWLSKESWGWWFETPSHSLWRHCNDLHIPQFTDAYMFQQA